jgi:release factor glutamine methyltransferase
VSDTLVSLWTKVRFRLQAAGVESPVFDARLLVEAGVGVSRLDLITDPRRAVSEAQAAAVEALAIRREAREPIAYILGAKSFWTLELAVGPGVLIPRPETETLVQVALSLLPADTPARLLDLGVGSGAILLAVLSERPLLRGVGVDVSETALEVASANAHAHGLAGRVDLRRASWGDGVEGQFDLVVSNPPYIAASQIEELAPEVARFEPRLALDGGADGLSAYRDILSGVTKLVAPGGALAFEVGQDQGEAVAALMQDAGLVGLTEVPDLAGIVRVLWGRRPLGAGS